MMCLFDLSQYFQRLGNILRERMAFGNGPRMMRSHHAKFGVEEKADAFGKSSGVGGIINNRAGLAVLNDFRGAIHERRNHRQAAGEGLKANVCKRLIDSGMDEQVRLAINAGDISRQSKEL